VDWRSIHLWQIQWVRDVLGVLAIVGLFWLGDKISVVTVPLLLAILLAYLFEPVIGWAMSKTAWKRQGTVAAVMVAAILVVVIPAATGLTFGVVQAIGFVNTVAENIEQTTPAVEAGRELSRAEAKLTELKVRGKAALEPDSTPSQTESETGPAPATESLPDRGILDQSEGESIAGQDAAEPPAGEGAVRQPPAIPPELARDIAEAEAEVASRRAVYEAALLQVEAESYREAAEFVHDRGGTMDDAFETLRGWIHANAEEIATAGAGALRTTLGFLGGLFGLLFMGFVTAFFFFFIATGWVELQRFGNRLLPEKHRDRTLDLLIKFDRVISAFIRGRLTIAFIQSIVFTIGYLAIGVPAAFILGPAVAVLSIVPYLALVGVPISIVLIAAQGYEDFRGEWWWIVGAPTVFYFIAQALDDYVWTPMIQGKSTDMSTPMILFASLAGGVLFGVFGLLIAIPIAACIKILVQEILWPRFKAWGEGREQDFLPIGRE
jgi:predicted PurR-regulated permease PerM